MSRPDRPRPARGASLNRNVAATNFALMRVGPFICSAVALRSGVSDRSSHVDDAPQLARCS